MPVSRDEPELVDRDSAGIGMPDSAAGDAPLPQTAQMNPQAAAVVLDAEPALVMGVEQSLESAGRPGMLAPGPPVPPPLPRPSR